MALATALLDYALPARLVAQTPAPRRDRSRLMVVDRAARSAQHRVFAELPEFIRPGDVLFRNNAAVLPARLRAARPTGGQVECLLLGPAAADPGRGWPPTSGRRDGGEVWHCLIRPGRKLPVGSRFADPAGAFAAEIIGRDGDGAAVVRFATRGGEPMTALARRLGEMPLPPYIERKGDEKRALDRERYQTVYADPARPVAAAAPTAGLHFTAEVLEAVAARGARTADITLHVGLGTFRPITAETVEAHRIHAEVYEIPAATQRALFPGPGSGRRIAVGTTSVRAIEDFLAGHSAPRPENHLAEAAIYIHPPFRFRGVDALITNFHQPRSTLLCLVAAFLTPGSADGLAWLKELYAEAIAREYRFFSYGDAMLIL